MKTTQTTNGTIIKILVKPKAKKFEIKLEEEVLTVFCRNVPEKGKVNKEIIKELSKMLKRRVEIVSGFTSKEKILLIKEVKAEELEALLRRRSR
jgi:uncharacterized protein (TIGR00251 family)